MKKQITKVEAQKMRALAKAGKTPSEIAKVVKRHPSTVWHYTAKKGHYRSAYR